MLSSENVFLNNDSQYQTEEFNSESDVDIEESVQEINAEEVVDQEFKESTIQFAETPFISLSAMWKAEMDSANETIQRIVSASESFTQQFFHQLTSIPLHPFERAKHDCFGENFVPITLNDVEVPQSFSCVAAVQEISAISDKFHDVTMTQVQALTCEDIPNECNVFAVLSGKEFVVQKEQLAKHVNFLDFVKNIPISVIEANPYMVAQKLTYQYIKSYK